MADDLGAAYQRYMAILGGIGRGLSANAIIKEVQALGLGLRLTTLRAIIADARKYWSGSVDAATADLNTPFTPDKNTKWPSKTMTGIGYVVQITYRDIGTGQTHSLHYTTVSDTPITPMQAINEALSLPADYFAAAERVITGAGLVNAFNYTPMMV